jgi:hypothetical protein
MIPSKFTNFKICEISVLISPRLYMFLQLSYNNNDNNNMLMPRTSRSFLIMCVLFHLSLTRRACPQISSSPLLSSWLQGTGFMCMTCPHSWKVVATRHCQILFSDWVKWDERAMARGIPLPLAMSSAERSWEYVCSPLIFEFYNKIYLNNYLINSRNSHIRSTGIHISSPQHFSVCSVILHLYKARSFN